MQEKYRVFTSEEIVAMYQASSERKPDKEP